MLPSRRGHSASHWYRRFGILRNRVSLFKLIGTVLICHQHSWSASIPEVCLTTWLSSRHLMMITGRGELHPHFPQPHFFGRGICQSRPRRGRSGRHAHLGHTRSLGAKGAAKLFLRAPPMREPRAPRANLPVGQGGSHENRTLDRARDREGFRSASETIGARGSVSV